MKLTPISQFDKPRQAAVEAAQLLFAADERRKHFVAYLGASNLGKVWHFFVIDRAGPHREFTVLAPNLALTPDTLLKQFNYVPAANK